MIIDTRAQFASAVAVNAVAGTALIGSQYDLGVAANMDSNELSLVIIVSTAIITGGSAGTISFSLASDTTAAISTSAANVHFTSMPFVTGASGLPAGTVLAAVRVPHGSGVLPAYKRFLGILCTIGTTTVTAGAITAFLTLDGARWTPVAQAVN